MHGVSIHDVLIRWPDIQRSFPIIVLFGEPVGLVIITFSGRDVKKSCDLLTRIMSVAAHRYSLASQTYCHRLSFLKQRHWFTFNLYGTANRSTMI